MDGRARAAREVVIAKIGGFARAGAFIGVFCQGWMLLGWLCNTRLFEVTAQPSSGWSATGTKVGCWPDRSPEVGLSQVVRGSPSTLTGTALVADLKTDGGHVGAGGMSARPTGGRWTPGIEPGV
jgi:hypothetical protein